MHWPIRNQILLPFCLVQAVAIAVISASSAWLAVNRAERDAVARLDRVAATLSDAQFPVRDSILAQMKGLSGADFIAAAGNDQITASTLPRETAHRLLVAYPANESLGTQLGEFLPLEQDDERWLVGGIELPRSPEVKLLLVLIPERQWLAVRRDVIGPPLVIGGVAIIATALMSWWIASRFGTRLKRIQQHVRAVASGQFDSLLPVSGNDELADLAESINRMAADLSSLTEQIRTSERTTLITQVAGGLAHQLRNSITGARMAIQLHVRRNPDAIQNSLEAAIHQLTLMENQIRGLLSLTKEAQQPVQRGRIDDILNRIRTLLAPRCEHGGVALWLEIPDDIAPGTLDVADTDQMEAALMNLVQNAIEACGSGGQVRITVEVASSEIRITVLDTGPGVPENLRDRVFDPFVTGKPEGIGLGLAQAYRAAESAGGTLTHSRNGDWTAFRLTVPGLTERSPSQHS